MALGRFSRGERDDGDGRAAVWRWERGEVPAVRGLAEPVANLPPVLLPAHPRAGDIDRLRFSAGFRGYRMDQVDEVLDILRDELADLDQQIAQLTSEDAANSGDEDQSRDASTGSPPTTSDDDG